MADWKTISSSEKFKALSPEQQQQVEAEYNASSTPAPSSNKPLKGWDEIEGSDKYQKLTPEQKLSVQNEYKASGGSTDSTGVIDTINAGLGSFGSSLNTGEAGLSNMLGDTLNKAGLTTLGGMAKQHATDLTDFNKSHYKAQIEAGRNSAAGRFAGEYGATAGNIAATIAAPELMIPAMAASSAGTAYEAQPEGNKSIAKAALVGGVDYLANKALPGFGGKIANKYISDPIARGTTELLSKAFKEPVSKAAGNAVGRAVENTVIGAVGGSASGGARAYSQGEDVIEGMKKGGVEGAEFGLALGATSEGVRAGKAVAGKISNLTTKQFADRNPEIPDNIKSSIGEQHTKISEARTPQEQHEALSNAEHYNAVRASQVNEHYGVPTMPQSFKGNKAGQEAFNYSEKQSNKDVSDISNSQFMERAGAGKKNTILSDVKAGADKMQKAVNNSFDSGVAALKAIKTNVGKTFKADTETTGTTSKARSSIMSDVDPMVDSFNSWGKAVKSGNRELAEKEAVRFQESYNDADPMFKTEFNKTYKAPEGFTEGVNLVAHTREYFDARAQQENLNPGLRKVNAEKGEKLGRINIFNPTGIPIDLAMAAPKAIASKFSRLKNVRDIKEAQAIAKSVDLQKQPASENQIKILQEMDHPEANNSSLTKGEALRYITEGKQEAPQPKGAPSDIGAKVRSKTIAKEIELERSKVVDPELQKEITPSNVRDQNFLKDLRKRDDVRNIQKVKKGAQYVEQATQNRLNVQHENATKEIERWHKEDAPYMDYNKYVKPAIESLQRATPEGNRIPSAQQVKNAAIKAYNKSEPKSYASRQSFEHALNQMNTDVKSQAKPILDKLFESNKQVSDDVLKQAWNKIHDLEAKSLEARGQTQAAKAALQRGELKAKAIDNNRITTQHDQIEEAMRQSIKDAHDVMPEDQKRMGKKQTEDFISTNINDVFKGNKPLSDAELNNAITTLKEKAAKAANQYFKKSPVETEEELGGKSEETEKAKEQFEQAGKGKPTEETQRNVENQLIHDTEKAFNSGDVETMKHHLDTVINHYFRNDSARVHTLTRFVDVLSEAQAMKKKYPNNPELWLTRTDVNSLAKAGNTHGGGMKSKLVDMVTGENFADQAVVRKMLTNEQRKAAIDKLSKAGQSSKKAGALKGQK